MPADMDADYFNVTADFYNFSSDDILDQPMTERTDIRAVFTLAYTVVFLCCFFGNLLVILVILLCKKMRTTTNMFLANLALADMCVAIFCLYPNLYLSFWKQWPLGDAMCRIFYFMKGTSYTASILIMVVMSVERYFVIMMPMKSRLFLTRKRLMCVTAIVWVAAVVNNVPWLILYGKELLEIPGFPELNKHLCVLHNKWMDRLSRFDVANVCVWYVLPLCVITFIYFRIAIKLWRSATSEAVNVSLRDTTKGKETTPMVVVDSAGTDTYKEKSVAVPDSKTKLNPFAGYRSRNDSMVSSDSGESNCNAIPEKEVVGKHNPVHKKTTKTKSSDEAALEARKKVIKLLIVVVVAFALCILPYHVFNIRQSFDLVPHTRYSAINAATATLIMYMHSGINPFLYAFFSEKFRKSMHLVLMCKREESWRPRWAPAQTSMTQAAGTPV